MKKTLSIILSIIMLLGIMEGISITATAKTKTENNFVYEIRDEKALLWGYKGKDKKIVIPSKLGGYPVKEMVSQSAGAIYSDGIEEITIPKSIKKLQWFSIPYTESLKSIHYKGSIDKWNKISEGLWGSYDEYLDGVTVYCTDGFIKQTKGKAFLDLNKVKVSRSAKKLVLAAKASYKDKGKKITFRFNGKKLTAKIDKNGNAKVTISKKTLKKLKKGRKITYSATLHGKTVKRNVTVKK